MLLRSADDKSNITDYIPQKYMPESTPEDEKQLSNWKYSHWNCSLLRTKVKFRKGETYGEIIQQFVNKVQIYPNCVQAFDGYNDDSPSRKYIIHLKWSRKVTPSYTVEIALHIPFNCESKDEFFPNKFNKQSFFNLLSKALENKNISVLRAKGDAD